MSKLDIRAAIRESGLNAYFEGNPGKVLLVTQEMLDAFPADEDSAYPEVEVGEAVVSYREGDRVRGKVILPGAENDLQVVIRDADREEHTIDIGSLSDLVSAVRDEVRDYDLPAKSRAALDAIDAYSNVVFESVLENSQFAAPETVSAALSFQLENSRRAEGEVEDAVTPEEMDRYTTARALRQTIGRIDADHADALAPQNGYASQGRSQEVIADLNVRNQGFSESQRRALSADRRLTEEVFGAMTTTSIGALSANFMDPAAFAKIRQDMRPGLVKGKFNAVIKERLDEIFEQRMPGYRVNVELYTKDGADLLLVQDHVGHYVYGWDTDSRVIEMPDAQALIIGKADIPSEEEIDRLRDIVEDLRFENGDEIQFDNFDGENGGWLFDMPERDEDDLNDDIDFDNFNDDPENEDRPGIIY